MKLCNIHLLLSSLVLLGCIKTTQAVDAPVRVKIEDIKSEGFYILKWNETKNGEYFRSITGLTYAGSDRFYAISEDDEDPNRFFKINFDMKTQPTIETITNLTKPNPGNVTVFENADLLSPQAIARKSSGGDLFIAHDNKDITLFDKDNGRQKGEDYADPILTDFEVDQGLTSLSFDHARSNILWTASEVGSGDDGMRKVRFIAINIDDKTVEEQYVYKIDGDSGNGVVSIIALDDNGSFLVLERIKKSGAEFDARLYYASSQNALNVDSYGNLDDADIENVLDKEHLVEFSELSVFAGDIGNFEAMALRSIDQSKARVVLVSNNEFAEDVETQFLVLKLDLSVIGVALPDEETDELPGDPPSTRAINAKAWLHPDDPQESVIFGTLGAAGFGVYALSGSLLYRVDPSGANYYGIDVLYAFEYEDDAGELMLVDLLIVSDVEDGTIDIYKINPDNIANDGLDLINGNVESGLDDPQAVVAYTSPYTGKTYVFVVENDGDDSIIYQLELKSDGSGEVDTTVVDRCGENDQIHLSGESVGMVVDREIGYLYVTVKGDNGGIFRFDAEPGCSTDNPTGGNFPPIKSYGAHPRVFPLGECEGDCDSDNDCDTGLKCFHRNKFDPVPGCSGNDSSRTDYCIRTPKPVTRRDVAKDINEKLVGYSNGDFDRHFTGLDIYYGKEYDGYLIASHQSDSTFAVFERQDDNDFEGFFTVGTKYRTNNKIDKADATEGVGIINVNLGPEFSCGLLIVQDANNEDPDIEEDDGGTLINSSSNFKMGT